MYRVTVEEIGPHPDGGSVTPVKRYEQVVDDIDMLALMATINRKQRKPRERKPKAAE